MNTTNTTMTTGNAWVNRVIGDQWKALANDNHRMTPEREVDGLVADSFERAHDGDTAMADQLVSDAERHANRHGVALPWDLGPDADALYGDICF